MMSSRIARISVGMCLALVNETARRLGVAEDGGERLVDFVGERGGDFTEHRGARGALDFRAELLDAFFGAMAADHMAEDLRRPASSR